MQRLLPVVFQSQLEAEKMSRLYVAEATPSVLRFLIAARDDVSSTQLRDDLLSMLVAGHETTASVLTWTFYELMRAPEAAAEARAEVDAVLAGRPPLVGRPRAERYRPY